MSDGLIILQVKGFAWMHRNDSNLTATARGMARELFSNKILALFSLHGGHAKGSAETKRAFDQLETYSVIIGKSQFSVYLCYRNNI